MARATIHDVARLAGVSHASVTRFFRKPELLAAGTRRRVERAVQQLEYVPNAAARSLNSGRTGIIALVVPDITATFYTSMMQGVEATAQLRGYSLLLANYNETVEKEHKLLHALIAHRVDGVILAPAQNTVKPLALLRNHTISVVLVDREIPEAELDTVVGDSHEGGRLLTRHLVGQGYRDIAFVGGPEGISSLEQRLRGYRSVMDEHHLTPRIYLGGYNYASGEETLRRLATLGEIPQAILAANSKVAVGVLAAARELGLRVPEDFALACVDDIESAALVDPFLTVAAQPAAEIGRIATEMLLERINGADYSPRKVVLPVNLITRRSSVRTAGPLPNG